MLFVPRFVPFYIFKNLFHYFFAFVVYRAPVCFLISLLFHVWPTFNRIYNFVQTLLINGVIIYENVIYLSGKLYAIVLLLARTHLFQTSLQIFIHNACSHQWTITTITDKLIEIIVFRQKISAAHLLTPKKNLSRNTSLVHAASSVMIRSIWVH